MRAVLGMRVIERQRTADASAVTEDDRAPRIEKGAEGRVWNRPAVHPQRLARDRAYGVEVMNRVIQDLEARRAAQEIPLLPRLAIDDAHFDVGDVAEHPPI